MNILELPFNTIHDTAPFSSIHQSDFTEAFNQAIVLARNEINEIVTNSESPTFENTIEALAFSGMPLDRISNIFFNLHSAETNDELDKIAQEVAPKLAEFGNDITLNLDLFNRIKTIYDKKDELNLNPEQLILLEKNYKNFVRNGALLNEDKKSELREIDAELSVLKLKFGEHVLSDTNAFQMHISDPLELSGLPEGAIEAAHELAQEQQKDGWIITLDYPSYIPFMTYADNRDRRKELAIASGMKAFQNNENNNENIVLKIVQLRYKRATLLGYSSHAEFVLEERMAKDSNTVTHFLYDLLEKGMPAAKKEFAELSTFAKQTDNIETLEKWDSAYYSEKLKKLKFDLDDEKLKPYFSLDKVLQGAFDIANRLYDINFKEIGTIDKYHNDVRTFEVRDNRGGLVAVFYADFFPRKGKRNGAWMTSFKSQYIKNGINERPHVSIVCNFTKPTTSKPSLLTFNEVTTLFHEFGHALHGMLANTTYPTLSGTSVYWDFVELPSQIMENWCYEEEALSMFATHYQTGEALPMEYIDKIKQSASFLEGLATVRQISFGLLDMGWHAHNPNTIKNLKEFELEQFASTSIYPDVVQNAMSPSFSHIFNGGYSSGYYSYKWAEVLDADAFEFFKEKGIFNKEVAARFKEFILSKGGTAHPMELYKAFRGQEPSVEPLLRRSGLID